MTRTRIVQVKFTWSTRTYMGKNDAGVEVQLTRDEVANLVTASTWTGMHGDKAGQYVGVDDSGTSKKSPSLRELTFQVTILAHETTPDDRIVESKLRSILSQRFGLKELKRLS